MPTSTTKPAAEGSAPAHAPLPAGISPYLMFGGRCEEALNFYKAAVGAQIEMLMHFNQSPEPVQPGCLPNGFENKVMHATFKMAGSTLYASDGNQAGTNFKGFSLSYAVKTESEAERVFNALSKGGKVMMPLTKTFYSPKFGMLEDPFGVAWMVIVV
jgi:PhnB protein